MPGTGATWPFRTGTHAGIGGGGGGGIASSTEEHVSLCVAAAAPLAREAAAPEVTWVIVDGFMVSQGGTDWWMDRITVPSAVLCFLSFSFF